jgi:hypothetical protein
MLSNLLLFTCKGACAIYTKQRSGKFRDGNKGKLKCFSCSYHPGNTKGLRHPCQVPLG